MPALLGSLLASSAALTRQSCGVAAAHPSISLQLLAEPLMQRRAASFALALEFAATPALVLEPTILPARFELAARLRAGEVDAARVCGATLSFCTWPCAWCCRCCCRSTAGSQSGLPRRSVRLPPLTPPLLRGGAALQQGQRVVAAPRWRLWTAAWPGCSRARHALMRELV
ncbi:hypothetical protein ABPG75_013766 [Micractinium tetrahymenae]